MSEKEIKCQKWFQICKNRFDLVLGQNNRRSTMPLRLDVVNAGPDVNIQDTMIYKQDGVQCLPLGGGGHISIQC